MYYTTPSSPTPTPPQVQPPSIKEQRAALAKNKSVNIEANALDGIANMTINAPTAIRQLSFLVI
jgi:hypothetical protein